MPKTPQSNVISIDGVNARTNKEAANMLAKQYEVTSRLNFAEEDRLQYKKYKSIIKHNKNHCAEDVFTSDFTLEELEYTIRCLNPKKSPGPDVISGQMIVHFGEIAKKYLLNIFITSWHQNLEELCHHSYPTARKGCYQLQELQTNLIDLYTL
ncbi:hypothetical protein TNCV_2018501 [Trichonephila clavipes]|nr:hypothetical protein TNCV_2018501 [Trichonephila clavipes]